MTNNIVYPENFKIRVSNVFKLDAGIMRALNENELILGRMLNDSICFIEPQEIIDYIESNKISKLKQRAEKLAKIQKLYDEWCKIINSTTEGQSDV